jgi:REP element-mobilizing transposase RayT
MPNHFHGIVLIDDGIGCWGTMHRAPTDRAPTREQFGKPTSNTIPTIIRGYKATVTKQINTIQINAGVYNTPERIWQKNYYEHVIRNEASLSKIREYIMGNPLNWKEDDYYLA